MTDVTSIERRVTARSFAEAYTEAYSEGFAKGKREAVLKFFGPRFGRIPTPIRKQLLTLSDRDLKSIYGAVFDIQSLNDLKRWLRDNATLTSE